MIRVFLTGATGAMGIHVLKSILALPDHKVTILLLQREKLKCQINKVRKHYADRIETVYGDVCDYDTCLTCVKDADYVIHCAALIPPSADYNPVLAEHVNVGGTKNIVDAINSLDRRDKIKFVYISSVAVYGNRDYHHPWGRVGDPLMPSCYDFYATTKMKAERYILDTDLPNWVILRQTGVLHENLLKNNLKDGLIFHSPYNTPIEWITAEDSGKLIGRLCERDEKGELNRFWKNVYNIGGGESCRVTSFETYDAGFKLMHAGCKDVFRPQWCATRNFHCMWFYDSDELNELLDFRTQSFSDFWVQFNKQFWYYRLGKYLPKSYIRVHFVEKVFSSRNAPMYWANHHFTDRIVAFFGSIEKFVNMPNEWKDFPLLCENNTPEGKIDYQQLKNQNSILANSLFLSHGFDDKKLNSQINIDDAKSAAEFRGGKCISNAMTKGDMFTRLEWECCEGHRFFASPFTVLRAGHWCEHCCYPAPWQFDKLAKEIPFFAQVWYDTHENTDDNLYSETSYKDLDKIIVPNKTKNK